MEKSVSFVALSPGPFQLFSLTYVEKIGVVKLLTLIFWEK